MRGSLCAWNLQLSLAKRALVLLPHAHSRNAHRRICTVACSHAHTHTHTRVGPPGIWGSSEGAVGNNRWEAGDFMQVGRLLLLLWWWLLLLLLAAAGVTETSMVFLLPLTRH